MGRSLARPLTGCVAALAMAAGLAACASSGGSSGGSGSSGSSGAGKTYNVLALLALSGPQASNGRDIQIGLKAGVAKVNSTGGIDGAKVKLTVEDDQGDANMAVTLTQSALSSGTKPDLVTVATPVESVPVEAILAKEHVLMIAIGAADQLADTTKYPLFFATAIDALDIQAANVAYAKQQGYTKIGFLAGTDALGQSSVTAFQQAAKGSGLSVAYSTFDPTSANLTPQIQKLQAAKPQAVFYDALGTPTGVILQDRHQLGWTVPFIGDSAVAVSNNYAFVPHDALTGALIQYSTLDVAGAPGKSPAYPSAYKALLASAKLTDPLAATGYGYDVPIIAQSAAKQAGSVDSTAIAKALEQLKTPSSVPWISKNGSLGFSTTSHTVHYVLKDFTYAPIGPVKDGLIQSTKG